MLGYCAEKRLKEYRLRINMAVTGVMDIRNYTICRFPRSSD
jgi:hypothetical protein